VVVKRKTFAPVGKGNLVVQPISSRLIMIRRRVISYWANGYIDSNLKIVFMNRNLAALFCFTLRATCNIMIRAALSNVQSGQMLRDTST
jgi:hypothetical protein